MFPHVLTITGLLQFLEQKNCHSWQTSGTFSETLRNLLTETLPAHSKVLIEMKTKVFSLLYLAFWRCQFCNSSLWKDFFSEHFESWTVYLSCDLAFQPTDCLTGWMYKDFRCGYKCWVWHLEINFPTPMLLKRDHLKIQRKRTQKRKHYALQYQIIFLRHSHLYTTHTSLSSHSLQGLSSTLVSMLTPPTEAFQS